MKRLAAFFISSALVGSTLLVGCRPPAPTRTLEELRDEARRTGAREIVVPAGTYRLTAPLALDARDSGVTWRADGEVVVSGAMTNLAWRALRPGEEPLIPASARPHVRVADVPGTGPLPGFASDSCLVQRQDAKNYEHPLAVFSDGTRCENARWPDDSFYVSETVPIVEGRDWKGEVPFRSPRLANWAREKDIYVRGFWRYGYCDIITRFASIDPQAGTFAIDYGRYHNRGRCRWPQFYVLNAFSELDRPGEWAADLAARRLCVWPKAGDDAPVVTGAAHLLTVTKAADIVFSGFTFEHAYREAVCLESCTNVRLVASCVRHTANWGVTVSGGRGCRVEGCDLYDLGEGGVRLSGGEQLRLIPANHVVRNCHIHHYGRYLWNYRPGVELSGTGCRAEHNLVHHTNHQGISFKGNDHTVSFNVIHDTCLYNDDAGAIYGYTESLADRGSVIENNCVFWTGNKPYPEHVCGLYLDGYFSECAFRGNIVLNTIKGFGMSGGSGNVIERNVFMNCEKAFGQNNYGVKGKSRTPYGADVLKGEDSNRCKPLFKILNSPQGALWREHYPQLRRWLAFGKERGMVLAQCSVLNTYRDNAYCCALKPYAVDSDLVGETLTRTNNVEIAGDPGFTDYAGYDWSLRPDSPIRAVIGGDTRFAEMGLLPEEPRFSEPVKFGADVTPVPKPGLMYVPPYARIDIQATSKPPEGETAFADGLERCDLIGGSYRVRRVAGNQGHAPFDGWKDYSYSFVPRYDCEAQMLLLGVHGMKTAYDDLRITGADWSKDGFEDPSLWKVVPPGKDARELADITPPLGIVAGTPDFPAAEGAHYAVSHHMMTVVRPLRLKKGVRVTVSFKARGVK